MRICVSGAMVADESGQKQKHSSNTKRIEDAREQKQRQQEEYGIQLTTPTERTKNKEQKQKLPALDMEYESLIYESRQ